ncbi:MAG: histidinol-phosphate transaminase [Phycisphaerae bacterium]|nr:histidinol-phosphate transaminase [Phycisphaerae bacterium]
MSYFRDNIEAMTGYVPGEQPTDPNVVKLNTNENPYPPSPRVLDALKNLDASALRKYPDPSATEAREAAAEVVGARAEQIICGNGSDELLTMIVRAFVPEGGLVTFPYPTYSLYEVLADIQGCRIRAVDEPEDFSLPPAEALLEGDPQLILVNNPNAPTGVFFPKARLGDLADRASGIVVVDEAYVDFSDADCLDLARSRPNVLVLRTLSKSYGLAGLRFGFAVGPEALIAGLMKVKDSYNCSRLAIELASAALRDQDYMRESVEKIRSDRRRLTEALKGRGFAILDSQTNFILATVPGGDGGKWYLELKKHGVLVRYFDKRRLRDKIRITIGTPAECDALIEAVDDIREA